MASRTASSTALCAVLSLFGIGCSEGASESPLTGDLLAAESDPVACSDAGTSQPDATTPPDPDDLAVFKDPGKGPWTAVPESEVLAKCKLDPAKMRAAASKLGAFAVVRYGLLCWQSNPNDAPSQMFSATKTLGATVTGIASWETRNIPRTGKKTGQLKDTDRADQWLDRISYNKDALLSHVMSMTGHNANLAHGSKRYTYDTIGTTQINTLSTMVSTAISQDRARLGTATGAFAKKFLFDEIGMTRSTWGGTQYATSWTGTLQDMARLGNLLIHQGVWSGKRILGADWVYKMTHPAYEDANTAYGYLTWLNTREGAAGIGGALVSGGAAGDPCAPPAVWQRYPHGNSGAQNCTYKNTSCNQKNDVGVFSAQGLGGQFIVGHPGLDLVIVAKNFNNNGPTGLWQALRPAVVAADPTFKGDEAAFCKAYAAGDHAPDLAAKRVQPAN